MVVVKEEVGEEVHLVADLQETKAGKVLLEEQNRREVGVELGIKVVKGVEKETR